MSPGRPIFLLALLSACGVSQQELDTLAAQNKALEARVARLEGSPAAVQSRRLEAVERQLEDWQPFIEFLRPIKAQMEAQARQQEESEPDPDAVFAVDPGASPSEGPADALVTIIVGYDLACPYCRQVMPSLDALVKEHPDTVRVVYKSFVVHPDTVQHAHLALCAAHKQGKYLAYERAWWTEAFDRYATDRDKKHIDQDAALALARKLKLDVKRFQRDRDSADCAAWVQADQDQLTTFGVRGTPAIFVNGKSLPGAVPKEQLDALYEQALTTAKASGVPAKDYYRLEILGKGEPRFKSRAQ